MNVIIANYRRNAKSRNNLQYVTGERVSRSRGTGSARHTSERGQVSNTAHSQGVTYAAGSDISKRPAAGATGCGGVPARMSPRSPEHPGRAHYSRSTGEMGGRIAGAVSSSCCRLRSHPPLRTGERPRDQRAMRWHDALLAPEVTVEQHRDRTPRSPMPIGARHVLSHERMRAEASV